MPQRGLRWYKIINVRLQTDNRLVSDVTGAMMSGRPDASRPGCRGSTRPAAILLPRHRLWRKRQKLMLARKLRKIKGISDHPTPAQRRMLSEVTSRGQVGDAPSQLSKSLLPSAARVICERRRFESGDPTPGGACVIHPDRRDCLVLGMSCAPVLEVGLPPVHGEQRDFCFLITSFLIQRRRLANGGATAMSTDPIYDGFDFRQAG